MNRERVESVVLADLARAKTYFEETVEPKLLERRDIYLASKEYYEKKFPALSKKTDFRSFGFYSYVQWAKAPILDALMGHSHVVHVVGCGPEDEAAAKVMERLVQWQISQQCAGYQICEQWVEDALIYEMGMLKVWWERSLEEREFQAVLPEEQAYALLARQDIEVLETGEPDYFGDIPVRFRQKFVLANKAVFDNVSPFDMRWSPEARTLESANFVAQRQRISASELREGVDRFGYDRQKVREICEDGGVPASTESEEIMNPELTGMGEDADPARRQIELYECYVNIDADGDGILEPLIVTVADGKVIRIEPNTYERIPFFMLAAHKDPAKVFSSDISMADISGELQHYVTAMVRQILVNTSISNKPRKFVNVRKVNMEDIIEDRTYVRCADDPGGAVLPEQPTQIAGWTMGFFELLKQYEEEWTGRTRYNQGMQADSLNKTATGITAIMRAGSQRSALITKNFAETGYKPMLRYLVMLNQRYMDTAQMIRVFGVPLQVAPDDIRGDLDIIVETDVGLEKRQEMTNALAQYLREVYPFAQQIGLAGPEHFKMACVRALEMSGLSDARQYFYTEEERMRGAVGEAVGPQGADAGGGAGPGVPEMALSAGGRAEGYDMGDALGAEAGSVGLA